MKVKELLLNGNAFCSIAVADSFFLRLRGMIGRKFEDFGAMAIIPCSQIHTLHMSFPIDVVYLDGEGKIIEIAENLIPNKCTKYVRHCRIVIELPAWTAVKIGIKVGDEMMITEESECSND